MNRGLGAKEQRIRKAAALRQRMREQGLTGEKVALLCGVASRDTVAKWGAGKHWPSQAGEHVLETVLALPRGFFARIAAQWSYEEAAQGSPVVATPDSLPYADEGGTMRLTPSRSFFPVSTWTPVPDLKQVAKFQEFLAYIRHEGPRRLLSVEEVAHFLEIDTAIMTAWAQGVLPLPKAALDLFMHHWDIQPQWWQLPLSSAIRASIRKRSFVERRTDSTSSATAAATQLLAEMSAQMRSLQEGCSRVERLLQSLVKEEIV